MRRKIFESKTPFERFGIMIDSSRNGVMNVDAVKRMIDLMQSMDYNMLMLYTEDTYEVDGQPYFGHLRGRYTKAELKEIDAYAKMHDIELIPCIQTLAHLSTLQHWLTYWDVKDLGDVLLVGEEKVYQMIDDMFATLAECFTSRLVNVGMDEAACLGLGKYLAKHGFRNRVEILCEHLQRVSEIADKYGFALCMWSDMFFKLATATGGWEGEQCSEIDSSIGNMIPDNVRLIYWDYYSEEKEHYDQWLEGHEKLKQGTMFAGGLWTWTGFAPHNTYSIKTGNVATQSCFEHKTKDVFYTIWGDDGNECSRFSILPSMFYNACIAHGINEENEIKRRFEENFGIAFDDYMLLDLPDTANAKGSYANPEKYMLYSDCFLGKFDLNVRKDDAAKYACISEKLQPLTEHSTYGIVFTTMKALCDVLAVKYDLGVRTREAYASGDRENVRALLTDYDLLVERIEIFYEAFRNQWMMENKPNGLEVHDTRIGGLVHRVRQCRRRLAEYVDGELKHIEELEEPVLDFEGRGGLVAEEDKHSFVYNSWKMAVTLGVM